MIPLFCKLSFERNLFFKQVFVAQIFFLSPFFFFNQKFSTSNSFLISKLTLEECEKVRERVREIEKGREWERKKGREWEWRRKSKGGRKWLKERKRVSEWEGERGSWCNHYGTGAASLVEDLSSFPGKKVVEKFMLTCTQHLRAWSEAIWHLLYFHFTINFCFPVVILVVLATTLRSCRGQGLLN